MRPKDSYVHYKVGHVYLQPCKYDTAIVQFDEAVELGPDFADAHFLLGVCFGEQGGVRDVRENDRFAPRSFERIVGPQADNGRASNVSIGV